VKTVSAFIIIAILSLFSSIGYAEEDFQIWNHYSASGPLGERNSPYSLRFDVQQRFQDSGDRLSLLVFGGQIGYKLNARWSLSGGYMWVPIFGPARNRVRQDEHRLLQQINYASPLPHNFMFSMRARIEERFLEAGDDVSLRFRELLRLTAPLSEKANSPYWILWNEVHYNLNSTEPGPQQGFNQNRAFAGLGIQPVKSVKVELGYVNHYNHRPGNTDRINHVVQLSADYLW